MDYIEGVAREVSHDLGFRNSEDLFGSAAAKRRHVCSFLIDGQKIKLSSFDPLPISEGDSLALAGRSTPPKFRVYAYTKIGSGRIGGPHPTGYAAIAAAALLGAGFVVNLGWNTDMLEIQWVTWGFSLAGVSLGGYFAVCGVRAQRARRLLLRHRSESAASGS